MFREGCREIGQQITALASQAQRVQEVPRRRIGGLPRALARTVPAIAEHRMAEVREVYP